MTISISNLTITNNASAGTVVGVLTAQDASGTVIPCNFTLTKNSAGFFVISGNLVTARASILAGNYSVRVHAIGTTTRFSGNAVFHITVNIAVPPPPHRRHRHRHRLRLRRRRLTGRTPFRLEATRWTVASAAFHPLG
jgi:hypothetical protein